ncbi:hypothetical protein V6N13_026782 [Hibiscus sabdariffa]
MKNVFPYSSEFSSIAAPSSNFQSAFFLDVVPQSTQTSPTTVSQSSGDHGGENGTTQAVPAGQQMHIVQEQQMHVAQEQDQVLSCGQQVLADQHMSVVQDQQLHGTQEQVVNSEQNEQIPSGDPHFTNDAELVDPHFTDGAKTDVVGSAVGQPVNSEIRYNVPSHLSNGAHPIEMGDGADSQVQHESVDSPVERADN